MLLNTTQPDANPVVITGFARTPIGHFQGVFSTLSAPILGSIAIQAAIERSNLKPIDFTFLDEVFMGCVLSAGLGQAPARQASLYAGLPKGVGCTTINKVCGSGMKAVMLSNDLLLVNTNASKIMIAGGMESMTNAPYLLDKARSGYRVGHAKMFDHMFLDGLEDAYDKGMLMGVFAEQTAAQYGFTRMMQDDFARTSLLRAQTASKNGWLKPEIVPVSITLPKTKETLIIAEDEHPSTISADKIPTLKPAFKENGTVTAANSSAVSDGAAALVLMRLREAEKRGLQPIAKIVGHASVAKEPALFTTAPIAAIQTLLNNLHWKVNSVDLYEINEAFAVVVLAALRDLNISLDKVNIHGGACAFGHPIGASGARIICTLLRALEQRKQSRGIAALCIGGGEATAIAIERY